MHEFLEGVWKTIGINIDDYIDRDFGHLQINFGCTGGQHRSVYSADCLAKHIVEKYFLSLDELVCDPYQILQFSEV